MAQSSDAGTLDPQKQGKLPDMNILINMFDTLVTRDANNQLAPGLATSWKQVDPTTWEFTLRQGVKFHDGEPFNASVVKYSIDRLKDPATKSPIVELTYVQEVKVVDDTTVDFLLSAPDPIIPNKLTLFGGVMVPPQYIQQHGDDYFSQNPVGTGPFKFVSWQKDNQVVMEANPEYLGGKPKVDSLVFRFVIATLQVAWVIIAEASLSYLGVGVPVQTVTWGGMLSDGQLFLSTAWWLAVFPGLAIVLTVLSVNLVGDALRDALDPRIRKV